MMAARTKIPASKDVEKLRLVLSTYQDGTGMLAQKGGTTLPGWRDFERAVAIVFGGEAQENKAIFDVLVFDPGESRTAFGMSCKMRRELNRIDTTGRVAFELSNSAGKFWDHLNRRNINQKNYRKKPAEVGAALLELVEEWHNDASLEQGGLVDLSRSSYFVLSWSKAGWYQLHQFPVTLPDPKSLKWHFPTVRCLKGDDRFGTLFEWYGESGGQLKYYPLAKNAIWSSERFRLEPLRNVEHGVVVKVSAYFPELWAKANRGAK
jgi:hypothetical protein